MKFEEDLNEIEKKLTPEEKERIHAEAKANAETRAMAEIVQDPQKALQTKLNSKVAEHIDGSKEVAEKIESTANKLVDNGLKVQENEVQASVTKSEDSILQADFEKNKNEYMYHGIDHKVDKIWKRKMLLIINDIWFVIWAIVSFFTIVPVSTFLSRIKALKGIVKGVAIVLGILLGLTVLAGLTYAIVVWAIHVNG